MRKLEDPDGGGIFYQLKNSIKYITKRAIRDSAKQQRPTTKKKQPKQRKLLGQLCGGQCRLAGTYLVLRTWDHLDIGVVR